MTETLLYEVFVRAHSSASHIHVGSVRAANENEALLNARDLYTRRGEASSLWLVRAADIKSSVPEDHAHMFQDADAKPFRHPADYEPPAGVNNL